MKYIIARRSDRGFGIVEAIASILVLTTIITYSVYFISLRQQTIYKANLTNAINDEITRDIEMLKLDLWSINFQSEATDSADKYLIDTQSCEDIGSVIERLPSWNPNSWKPGGGKLSLNRQMRNNIFKGHPITITRELEVAQPIYPPNGSEILIDRSLARLVYKVRRGNSEEIWTSIDLSSEAHSWCPPM